MISANSPDFAVRMNSCTNRSFGAGRNLGSATKHFERKSLKTELNLEGFCNVGLLFMIRGGIPIYIF